MSDRSARREEARRRATGALTASLTVDGLTVAYPNGALALENASFTLGGGTIAGLVGVNGSGKSTLFKAIMGFVTPSAGLVTIAGLAPREAQRLNLVAYVPQSEEVDWNFPVLVEDVVMMGRYGHMGLLRIPSRTDRGKVDEALERVGMTAYRGRQIGELSGGQRKRVFLARALAQEGLVMLLDEPFTGVDVKTEEAIVELLRSLRAQGHLMLVSTHNLGSVPEFCDQVVLVRRTVIAAGPTASTFTQGNLERAFGGVLRHFRLEGTSLHADDDRRSVTVLTDDERPVVFYGAAKASDRPLARGDET
ncbi:MAG: manganese/iron ABC transporter ATP-binding protein [Hyphomicrobiaceae bacterium]|nr:manganese/iron ABC transporter ATP-binding protein [Hyphomicrobiaceae bacterium]